MLNKAQRFLHHKLEEQKARLGYVRAMILKGRQQGCSTYVGGRFYHLTTHGKGIRTFILTHDRDATQNLFDMVNTYHDNVPSLFRPHVGTSNRKELIFDRLRSGYRVGTAGSRGVGRSATIQLFHGSEVAFWPKADEHAAGILQAIPKERGTEAILESTAKGIGGYFHSRWQSAVAGDGDFIPIFIPWYWQDEYSAPVGDDFELTEDELNYMTTYGLRLDQMAWRRNKIIELNTNNDGGILFKQEYPATADEAFQATGHDSLIKTEYVVKARRATDRRSYGAVIVGYDPSEDGKDRDCSIFRQGLNAWGLRYCKFAGFPQQVAYCKRILDSSVPYVDRLIIDNGGGGYQIAGKLREDGYGDRVRVVKFGSRARRDSQYANKRSEMWGDMRDWLHNEDEPPSIPDDDALHADLVAAGYEYDSNGRLALESKKDIRKKGFKSPDGADALALTFAEPVIRKRVNKDDKPETCKHEYKVLP